MSAASAAHHSTNSCVTPVHAERVGKVLVVLLGHGPLAFQVTLAGHERQVWQHTAGSCSAGIQPLQYLRKALVGSGNVRPGGTGR